MATFIPSVPFSLCLFFVGALLLHKSWPSRLLALLLTFTAIGLLGLSGLYFAANHFTGTGIDYSVIYHLNYGLAGAGFGEYSHLILYASVYLGFSILAAAFLYYSHPKLGKTGPLNRKLLGIALVIISIFTNPGTSDLLSFYLPFHSKSGSDVSAASLYKQPYITLRHEPKNLLFIYLESFERTYFNNELFPGLTPHLQSLEENAISFLNVGQAGKTGFTLAGFVGSQCGIPMETASHGNSMGALDQFLPKARCIGDILHHAGYTLHYMGGSNKTFAGKLNFLKTHGFSRVEGKKDLVKRLRKGEVDPKSWTT